MLTRLIVFSCVWLGGCAGITVQALDQNGNATGQAEGIRYYMPRPYLLVMALPPTVAAPASPASDTSANDDKSGSQTGATQQAQGFKPASAANPAPAPVVVQSGQQPVPTYQPPASAQQATAAAAAQKKKEEEAAAQKQKQAAAAAAAAQPRKRSTVAGAGGGAGAANDNGGDQQAGDNKSKGNTTSAAASPSSTGAADTSFFATTTTYVAKLIYLPDMTRPMAISQQSGLLGTASVQISLENGWMLSSVNGSADNKVAETLQSIAGIIASVEGGGAAAAGKASGKGGTASGAGGENDGQRLTSQEADILAPGLYAFDYDQATGRLKGFCSIRLFGSAPTTNGSIAPCQ